MEQNNQIDDNTILDRYQKAIDYYWSASNSNKKAYKRSRFLIIILSSLVTLMTSMSSASFIEGDVELKMLFAILTPVLAVSLTIIAGLAQSFRWGAAWRDMVINAERLVRARDLFLASKPAERDFKKELDAMHNMFIEETQSFFQRVLESEVKTNEKEGENTQHK